MRLLVLCSRPVQLAADEAEQWLRAQARELLADGLAERIDIVALGSASPAWARQHDYLLEVELRDGSKPSAVVRARACADLLGDLRLLGMRPAVLVADERRTTPVHDGER